MKILYVSSNNKEEEKEKSEFIKSFFTNDSLTVQKIQSINNLDFILNRIVISEKNSDYIILDFELFKRDTMKTIAKIKEISTLNDSDVIVLAKEISRNEIDEFHINGFYNIAISGNEQLLKDILQNKVDDEYLYDNLQQEQDDDQEEFFIFNKNTANIQITATSEELLRQSFFYSVNFAKYLNTLSNEEYKVYFTDMLELGVKMLEKNKIVNYHNDYYIESGEENIVYSINSVSCVSEENTNGFFIFFTNIDEGIAYDLKIVFTDTSIDNLNKCKELTKDANTFIFLINVLVEEKNMIDAVFKGCDKNKIIKLDNIRCLTSIVNRQKYKSVIKEKLIEFF